MSPEAECSGTQDAGTSICTAGSRDTAGSPLQAPHNLSVTVTTCYMLVGLLIVMLSLFLCNLLNIPSQPVSGQKERVTTSWMPISPLFPPCRQQTLGIDAASFRACMHIQLATNVYSSKDGITIYSFVKVHYAPYLVLYLRVCRHG